MLVQKDFSSQSQYLSLAMTTLKLAKSIWQGWCVHTREYHTAIFPSCTLTSFYLVYFKQIIYVTMMGDK